MRILLCKGFFEIKSMYNIIEYTTNLTLNTNENLLLSNLILSFVNNNYNNIESNEYKDIPIFSYCIKVG